MRQTIVLAAVAILLSSLGPGSAVARDYFNAQPEHQFLDRFEGEWSFEQFPVPSDDSEPEALGSGSISATRLGELFVVLSWSGQAYGLDYAAVQTLGYDVERESYTGTWIDNLMNYRWQLDGTFGDDGEEFILSTAGPMPDGSPGQFRERLRFESADAISLVAEMMREGEWQAMSKTRLTRR